MNKDYDWLDGLVGLLLALPVAFWSGYVASVLWGWFAVTSLGVPPISAVPAAGLILMLSFMHPTSSNKDKDEKWSVTGAAILRAFTALIALGVGAILNLFM